MKWGFLAIFAWGVWIQWYHIHYHNHCTPDKVTCTDYCEKYYK